MLWDHVPAYAMVWSVSSWVMVRTGPPVDGGAGVPVSVTVSVSGCEVAATSVPPLRVQSPV